MARSLAAWLWVAGAAALLVTQVACVASFAPRSSPSSTSSGAAVDQAVSGAGLMVCSSQVLTTLPPGATAGVSDVVAADCDDTAHQTIVMTETYATQNARDAAIRNYLITVPGRAGQKNGMLTVGNTLITIPGPRDDAAFELLERHLYEQGAE